MSLVLSKEKEIAMQTFRGRESQGEGRIDNHKGNDLLIPQIEYHCSLNIMKMWAIGER